MKKADLHVHSKYSDHPSEWFLQRIGTSESYTEPDFIYHTAKEQGMDFVTITDHNSIKGALELNKKYPADTFISVESTAYFPEDNGKVHILIYGINQEHFDIIQEKRKNIYELRDYLKSSDIAHSVAHATYSVNGSLTLSHLEKLILLFDNFEVVNGGRNEYSNINWHDFLRKLSIDDVKKLKLKHNIEPFSTSSWIKGYTGGSDDHAGIFLGRSYTIGTGDTSEEFLVSIKNKWSYGSGRHNDYRGLAFTIYKIAFDFAKSKSTYFESSFLMNINNIIFENKKLGIKDRIKMMNLKKDGHKNKKHIKSSLVEFIEEIQKEKITDIGEKLERLYDKAGVVIDEYLKSLLSAFRKDIKKGDFISLVKNISGFIPWLFLGIPFLSTLQHMYNDRHIVNDLKKSLGHDDCGNNKKVLWFTDTIDDLNGVSVTLRKISAAASDKGHNLFIVSSFDKSISLNNSQNIINLEAADRFEIPYYDNAFLKIPSFLKMLKTIYEQNPDEIYISTPGPIGLAGLLIGKILKLKTTGVYHTDFTMQTNQIINDASLEKIVESYLKWFYSSVDIIKVPTNEYISILGERGYDSAKMSIFRRAIETHKFRPYNEKSNCLKEEFGVKNGINLLYTGRVSKDKGIDFLIDIYKEIKVNYKKINLVIVGDGPDYGELSKKHRKEERLFFTGRVKHDKLPDILNSSHLLVFPSITDTFGMSVLEAQSCGLPALVSDVGGPKEIVIDQKTGYVLKAYDKLSWKIHIEKIIESLENDEELYKDMSNAAVIEVRKNYNWDLVFSDIYGS